MQVAGDRLVPVHIGALDGGAISVNAMRFDRDDALWVGTDAQGLWHVANERVDHYGSVEGLTGDHVNHLFEDREGNVWVTTTSGLDMFRALPVVSIGQREGLAEDHVDSIMASRNGEVWASSGSTINIISEAGVRMIGAADGVPGKQITSLFEDRTGDRWVGVDESLYVVKGRVFEQVTRADGRPLGRVLSMAQDVDGSVLALTIVPERRIFRLAGRTVVDEGRLPDAPPARALAAGASGIWLGTFAGDLARYENSAIAELVEFDHNPESFVQRVTVESDGAVYGATRIGLAAWKNGRKQMLTARNGLPCAYFYTHLFDDRGDLWLLSECGLMRIPREEVAAWWEDPARRVSLRHFDMLDGAHPGFVPFVASAKTPDGRLWFTNSAAVLTIDPERSAPSDAVPTVIVEHVAANGETQPMSGDLTFEPLLRRLQIDYTATSLSVPQRVKFRYKLQGMDEDWVDAGSRRQAFYNDLAPGAYTFEVTASNSDGVWNAAAASALRFSVKPAWYQTLAFRIAIAMLALAAIYGAYVVRIRRIERTMNTRFSERLEERNRIARELHDTLLQTLQGSKMVADGILQERGGEERPRWAMEKLSQWLDRAVNEVRAAVDALRMPADDRDDLVDAFRRAADELFAGQAVDIDVSSTGTPSDLDPELRNEIYRIGYEAIRNAWAHAQARTLKILIAYADGFALLIADDGCGIDARIQAEGKPGHFGLRGIHERASRIGAHLTIRSRRGEGTQIRLTLPRERLVPKERIRRA